MLTSTTSYAVEQQYVDMLCYDIIFAESSVLNVHLCAHCYLCVCEPSDFAAAIGARETSALFRHLCNALSAKLRRALSGNIMHMFDRDLRLHALAERFYANCAAVIVNAVCILIEKEVSLHFLFSRDSWRAGRNRNSCRNTGTRSHGVGTSSSCRRSKCRHVKS